MPTALFQDIKASLMASRPLMLSQIHSHSTGVNIFKSKFFLKFFLMFVYFSERQSLSGGGAEREGDTESEAGSGL